MNKAELLRYVAKSAGVSNAAAGNALDTVVTAIKDGLRKGDMVTLVGFGTFYLGKRAARAGRNPRTGASVKIEAKNVVKFRSGKVLDDAVNAVKPSPYKIIKLFFGTDRDYQAAATRPRDYFSDERGHSIRYGYCEVSIPPRSQEGRD